LVGAVIFIAVLKQNVERIGQGIILCRYHDVMF
jgi:hypothetical protein